MFTSRQNEKSKQSSFLSQMTSGAQQPQSTSVISMLSPRNLMKFVSSAIDEYNTKPKIYKPDYMQQQEFLISFQQYWLKIQHEYKRYTKNRAKCLEENKKEERNEQIQFKLKQDRIPQSYFQEKYELFFTEKFNNLALRRKQQEVTEYLDEIQLLLWNKTSKNPQKYFNCVDNFNETIMIVQGGLEKVKNTRQNNHKKLMRISKSQLRIKSICLKKQRIEQTLSHLQCIKKLKSIKQQSEESIPKANTSNSHIHKKLQILQNIKKKQLQVSSKIFSLSKIVSNLQFYRQQIKSNIYDQFNSQIIELMGKLLAYDKNAWQTTKVSPHMLGKEGKDQHDGQNPMQESRLNITILDQSCFGLSGKEYDSPNYDHNSNDDQQLMIHKNINQNSQSVKKLIQKLNQIWQAITKFDLYDEEEINELIMRQLIRHNVMWNKDLEEYLARLFAKFENAEKMTQESMKPILEDQQENQEDLEKSKEVSSTEEASQEIEDRNAVLEKTDTPKKTNKYFSSITEMAGINQLKNLKDLSQLKKKTINTFKRFGNMNKIGQALSGSGSQTPSQPLPQKGSYCKIKQNQLLEVEQKPSKPLQQQEKLSLVDTKFFLKAVKFYYEILSNLTKFMKDNPQLIFFQNFLEKFYSFIEERVKYFFSLRHISQKTSVADFLLYLNLIQYWVDVCDDVYENLHKLKSSVTDEFLTNLQKNALVNELKKSIDESLYLPLSISSVHINTFYYVFFWSSIQQLKQQQANNMSLTILKDDFQKTLPQQESPLLMQLKNFQKEFKIIDKKIIYKRDEFFVCQSFVVLVKELEKYLQLREVLVEFNSNIEEKICEVVGFYVWYNLKNINKSGPNTKSRTLKNLCNIHSTISFLKIIFTEQLHIHQHKKYTKTLDQFTQFFKSLQNSITMTPYLLIQQQISLIYQNNALSAQFQIPCKQTIKILEILKLSLEELKIHFCKDKIVKILQPTIKVITKNYFGYLASLGKRGLLEIKEFLPKYKELLLNYGFRAKEDNGFKQQTADTHIFLKEITQLEKSFKSKVAQLK